MSCDYPIPSIAWIVFHGINYADGCGDLRITEDPTAGDVDCDLAELGDLTLLSMAFDRTNNWLKVDSSSVAIGALCAGYDLRVVCDEEPGLSQLLREALTTDGATASIRTLKVTGETVGCMECADEPLSLVDRIARSFVTDGTDTYVLLATPGTEADSVDCTNNGVGGQTVAGSPLVPIGSCGMWAWRFVNEPAGGGGGGGGDFNDDFNDDFNI